VTIPLGKYKGSVYVGKRHRRGKWLLQAYVKAGVNNLMEDITTVLR
jgi:hypothetical protein